MRAYEVFDRPEAGEQKAEQADGDGDVHVELALGGVLRAGQGTNDNEGEAEPGCDERGGMSGSSDDEEIDADAHEEDTEVEGET